MFVYFFLEHLIHVVLVKRHKDKSDQNSRTSCKKNERYVFKIDYFPVEVSTDKAGQKEKDVSQH